MPSLRGKYAEPKQSASQQQPRNSSFSRSKRRLPSPCIGRSTDHRTPCLCRYFFDVPTLQVLQTRESRLGMYVTPPPSLYFNTPRNPRFPGKNDTSWIHTRFGLYAGYSARSPVHDVGVGACDARRFPWTTRSLYQQMIRTTTERR